MTHSETAKFEQSLLPQHIAIIMDGNGRWAQLQGKTRVAGHKSGVESVRACVTTARQLGVKALTLFAFSSENWQRPEKEVSVLMELFMFVLNREVKRLHKNDIRFKVVGDIGRFSEKLQRKIAEAEALTANNQSMVLSIAANYGGKWDIAQAAQKLAQQVKAGTIEPEQIDEHALNQHICLAETPELDLLIRTGGDFRISNFLLWQAAYAEFYFTETLWPDFKKDEFEQAIETFIQRERRFGKTSEQVTNSK